LTDALEKISEVEAQSQGGENGSLEDTLASVKSSEAGAAGAQTASSMARVFIQMKALEVKRFSKDLAADAGKKFADLQSQLEIATKRLAELNRGINKRKRLALVRETETRVAKAEGLVERMKEAASVFADDSRLLELSIDLIREASERTTVCEKEANESLMEVRKFVTARQIEAKGKDASVEVSTELIKFQTRLSAAQAEVAKQKKVFSSVEQRLAVKRLLDEAEKRLKEMEEKVASAMSAVAGLDTLSDEEDAKTSEKLDKLVKDAELAVHEAHTSIRLTSRFLEQQSRSQGFAREALSKLEPRTREAQEKVSAADITIKARGERSFVKGVIQESEQKVSECEAGMAKVAEAEAAFAAIEDSAGRASTIAALEKAIQAAQSVASSAKTFISMNRLAIKRLTDISSSVCNEALAKMQTSVDEVAKKLALSRTKTVELKRSATGFGATAKSSSFAGIRRNGS